MKKLLFAVATTACMIAAFSFTAPTKKSAEGETLTVDEKTSKVEFIGSKKEGYHPGFFTLKSGSVTVDNGKLTGGKFVIDLSSLKITDWAGEKLEGHLKGKDFFNVESFAEATYEISGVTPKKGDLVEIKGSLSIHGLSVPVNFPAHIRNASEGKFFGQASFSLDRTTIGLTAAPDKISKDVAINVFLFAKK